MGRQRRVELVHRDAGVVAAEDVRLRLFTDADAREPDACAERVDRVDVEAVERRARLSDCAARQIAIATSAFGGSVDARQIAAGFFGVDVAKTRSSPSADTSETISPATSGTACTLHASVVHERPFSRPIHKRPSRVTATGGSHVPENPMASSQSQRQVPPTVERRQHAEGRAQEDA